MHIKAPQKLFIFKSSSRKSPGDVKNLQRDMAAFTQHVRGEEYVFIEFRKPGGEAFWYNYEVRRMGKIRSVKFSEPTSIPLLSRAQP